MRAEIVKILPGQHAIVVERATHEIGQTGAISDGRQIRGVYEILNDLLMRLAGLGGG